jgi:hypothetical protein
MLGKPTYQAMLSEVERVVAQFVDFPSAETLFALITAMQSYYPQHKFNGTMDGVKSSDILRAMERAGLKGDYTKMIPAAEEWEQKVRESVV